VLLSVDFVDVETPTLFRRTPGVSTGNTTT